MCKAVSNKNEDHDVLHWGSDERRGYGARPAVRRNIRWVPPTARSLFVDMRRPRSPIAGCDAAFFGLKRWALVPLLSAYPHPPAAMG